MEFLAYFFFSLYLISLTIIGLYCLSQFHLFILYLTKKNNTTPAEVLSSREEWPSVTIQLPLFNEKYVAERLIDNIIKMDYPKDKLFVHILDDSTDETKEITKQKTEFYQSAGFAIQTFYREDRTGFKAGALKEGMLHVTTPFVAIFDADFMPEPDFLKKTMPYFDNPDTGVVQTRWLHLNQHESLLTEMQAIQLNVHFTVEQAGRYKSDYLLQFNGTAGVWRTRTIADAGGWQADTLTEDLDLSYRAQLKDWKIVYLEDAGSPAELPKDIHGLKSQQFRWMKGGAENAKKMLSSVWSSGLKGSQKLHATSHLMASSVFPAVLLLGISSVPLVWLVKQVDLPLHMLQIFLASFASIVVIYFTVNVLVLREKRPILWQIIKFLLIFPIFMSLSMALALHNSLAVIQGWLGKKSPFIRTPKYGEQKRTFVSRSSYFSKQINGVTLAEAVLAVYFVAAIFIGFHTGIKDFAILHGMLALGYSSLVFYTLRDASGR